MPAQPERESPVPVVIAIVTSADEAEQALAAGANALDPGDAGVSAAIRARRPAAPLWSGQPVPVECDQAAGLAATIAVAAIATWQGAPAVRTREARAVRRAVDMAAAIRGDRPPARTLRGLA